MSHALPPEFFPPSHTVLHQLFHTNHQLCPIEKKAYKSEVIITTANLLEDILQQKRQVFIQRSIQSSKRFILYIPDRPVHSDTISASLGSIQPYAIINARRLLVHISTTVYSQLSELEQYRVKKIAQGLIVQHRIRTRVLVVESEKLYPWAIVLYIQVTGHHHYSHLVGGHLAAWYDNKCAGHVSPHFVKIQCCDITTNISLHCTHVMSMQQRPCLKSL